MQNKSVSTEFIPHINDLMDDKKYLIEEIKEVDDLIAKVQANCTHEWIPRIINKGKVTNICTKCNLQM